MGNLSICLVQLDSGKQIKVTMPNQVRTSEFMIDWDDRVSITWHANSPVALLS
jgi:putrescine transport system ATP-binding protein